MEFISFKPHLENKAQYLQRVKAFQSGDMSGAQPAGMRQVRPGGTNEWFALENGQWLPSTADSQLLSELSRDPVYSPESTVGSSRYDDVMSYWGREPSASGILGSGLTIGDIAQMGSMVAGAYGLGAFTPAAAPTAAEGASIAAGMTDAAANPALYQSAAVGGGGAPIFTTAEGNAAFANAAAAPSTYSPVTGYGGSTGITTGLGPNVDAALGYTPPALSVGGATPWEPQAPLPGTSASTPSLPVPNQTGTGIFDKIMSSPALLGTGLGALAGGLGGSKQAGTITVEEGIPDWLQGYVKPQLDKYSSLVQNYNTDPYGVMPTAMKEFRDTVSGTYLDPSTNKWLPEYFKLGAERVKGALQPSFGHMQAFGSHSGYNEALSRGLSDLAVGLYGGNYEKERDRQYQLTAQAPNFLTQSTQSAFAPFNSYLGTVGSLGKKKTEPYFDNPMGNIFGGALTGYGLGSIFK